VLPKLLELGHHLLHQRLHRVRHLCGRRFTCCCTDFEYRLRRRAAERRDFERYIEMTLERLLKMRRDRLGIKKGKGTGKFSCVQHIHFIFDRAVKKFRGDVDLWLEWIAYAKSEMSSKVLSKIFARSLQLHPRNAKLWVHAAAYEWDMGNVTASRALLQRGIRLNSKAEELWSEYFRMEVLFTARLAERRRVLGLGKETKKAAKEMADGDAEEPAIAIGDLDEEAKGDSKDAVPLPDAQSVDAGLEELLAGSIPKAVIRYARETMGSSPDLFFSMYDMCYLAGDKARSTLEEEILTVMHEIAASSPPTAASVASSEAAAAAATGATAAAMTGTATRRAARAMAALSATSGAEAAACQAAQKVLDAYLDPFRESISLSPRVARKSAKKENGD
jgi:U3 small nucleolar RNA-associated protein 6